jgi:hypothetical protein
VIPPPILQGTHRRLGGVVFKAMDPVVLFLHRASQKHRSCNDADKNQCEGPFSNRGKASMRRLWRINRDSITRTHQAARDNPRHYPGTIVRSWSCAKNG